MTIKSSVRRRSLSIKDSLNEPSSSDVEVIQLSFDYSVVEDESSRLIVESEARNFKRLLTRSVTGVVDMGKNLREIQSRIPVGAWVSWLKIEAEGLPDRTARQWMKFAEDFEQLSREEAVFFLTSQLPYSTIFPVISPSTPPAAKTEVMEKIKSGKTPSVREVNRILKKHSPPPQAQAAPVKTQTDSQIEILPQVVRVIPKEPEVPMEPLVEPMPPLAETVIAVHEATGPLITVRKNRIYAVGRHYIYSGSPSDPRFMKMQPLMLNEADGGVALFNAAIAQLVANDLGVFTVNSQVFIASANLPLINDIIDQCRERSGLEVREIELR